MNTNDHAEVRPSATIVDGGQPDSYEGGKSAYADITADDALDVLANARRRRVIKLVAADAPRTLGELAEELARQECGYDATSKVLSAERKRVYIALYQGHLEKLEVVGAIAREEYDEIRSGKNTAALAELIKHVETRVSDE